MPEHILSLSYGKDSTACFGACELLGWPIDRVVTADVWATETIPANLPPMVEFKEKFDRIIKERWGIEVEHIRCRNTYQDVFYRRKSTMAKKNPGQIRGWPMRGGPGGAWCQGDVKLPALRKINNKRRDRNVMYLGIAADEPNRFHSLSDKKRSPLVERAGQRPTAAAGAKRMTCCPQSTPRLQGAVAGSATTRVWISCGSCGRTTRSCGRSC